ncbi:hypothetical protein ON010_g14003 [Phytophthora cinnamomi]|nr:hypothetical protein ON010_g14003 [Phytophthora cinnamomi]
MELMELNQIQEVIYEGSADASEDSAEEITRYVNSVQVLTSHDQNRSRNVFDFVRESGYVAAVTRRQAKEQRNHVRFANEVSVIGPSREELVLGPTGARTEDLNDEQAQPRLDATAVHEPCSDDVDPSVVQEECRRRISAT